jgi:hypothetical protein
MAAAAAANACFRFLACLNVASHISLICHHNNMLLLLLWGAGGGQGLIMLPLPLLPMPA